MPATVVVTHNELPPITPAGRVIAPFAVLSVGLAAAVTILARSEVTHGYALVGGVLSLPVGTLYGYRQVLRKQRHYDGTLWVSSKFSWTKGRATYIVPH